MRAVRLVLLLASLSATTLVAQVHVAQDLPTTVPDPVLTDDQVMALRAIEALAGTANAECQALASAKAWRELRQEFVAKMESAYVGYQIDWATKTLVAKPSAK